MSRRVGKDPEKARTNRLKSYHKNKDTAADYYLRRTRGISLAEYDVLLASQDGSCAICRKVCATGRRLAVDHDHETGVNRGLLCFKCNTSLGGFDDSMLMVESALRYLRSHSGTTGQACNQA